MNTFLLTPDFIFPYLMINALGIVGLAEARKVQAGHGYTVSKGILRSYLGVLLIAEFVYLGIMIADLLWWSIPVIVGSAGLVALCKKYALPYITPNTYWLYAGQVLLLVGAYSLVSNYFGVL